MTDEIKNQEPKKEEKKQNKRITIFDKRRKSPLPRIEKFKLKDLFDLLPDHFKTKKHLDVSDKKYLDLNNSLKDNGYAPEKFSYIFIKKMHQLQIKNGKKRVILLHDKNPEKIIRVVRLEDFKYISKDNK